MRELSDYRSLDEFRLLDLEAVRLVMRGGSVIDWHRLNFEDRGQVDEFLDVLEYREDDPVDRARLEAIKQAAIGHLKRNYDFPVPKPVASSSLAELLWMAAGRGHRQLCACTILKVMHVIHHLEARELLFMLPTSDQEVFHLVEQKVYRVIGSLLARGFPILEFIGGRKSKDSLYLKLLSKPETLAAQIYDKLRFRIVTRTPDDIFSVLNYLMRRVFPFNYVIPTQSTNTVFNFRAYCEAHPRLRQLLPRLQLAPDYEERLDALDNPFSATSYRAVNFVVDMPVRLPDGLLETAPPSAWSLGRVIFVQTEFQIIDRETEQANELGDASHAAYKNRQKLAAARRLKLGLVSERQTTRDVPKRTDSKSAPSEKKRTSSVSAPRRRPKPRS